MTETQVDSVLDKGGSYDTGKGTYGRFLSYNYDAELIRSSVDSRGCSKSSKGKGMMMHNKSRMASSSFGKGKAMMSRSASRGKAGRKRVHSAHYDSSSHKSTGDSHSGKVGGSWTSKRNSSKGRASAKHGLVIDDYYLLDDYLQSYYKSNGTSHSGKDGGSWTSRQGTSRGRKHGKGSHKNGGKGEIHHEDRAERVREWEKVMIEEIFGRSYDDSLENDGYFSMAYSPGQIGNGKKAGKHVRGKGKGKNKRKMEQGGKSMQTMQGKGLSHKRSSSDPFHDVTDSSSGKGSSSWKGGAPSKR